ncbi:uncharacterized protein LOC141714197 [Apium graveolens]|uniref:uncharacterized protein LOC141714197 n=1 Tax=Apium graveolens TaxID=4045 RepID=UPI003D7A9446
MYVVEFQKRGLPHVHMLIWLDDESKRNLAANVDKFVSAEIPDPLTDPVGYEAVKYLMIHGPCGLENTKSPCMKEMKCSKHFPKKETYFDQSRFPIYLHRNTGIAVAKGKNLKYLFKYCLKGHDRATVEITTHNKNNLCPKESAVHEINAYFDGRYICASEAAYQIFGYHIHYRSISVLRLSFHLSGERSCTFSESDILEKVVRREQHKHSQLEAYFLLNRNEPHARKYTYDEIPQYYVWNESDRVWTVQKKAIKLVIFFTLTTVLVSDLRKLWEQHWNHMVDDILMKRRDSLVDDHNDFSDKQLQYCRETYFDQSGFPIYLPRNTGIAVAKGKNLKYLFKYCLKGYDRATVEITTHNKNNLCPKESDVDEINAYFDGRYICASEAAYRIFGYHIHYRSIYVLLLSFHLPGERSCTFSENDILEKVVRHEQHKHSQLEAYFLLNRNDPHARKYKYDEIPQYYVWNESDRVWTVQKKGRQIDRLLYTHHSAGELCRLKEFNIPLSKKPARVKVSDLRKLWEQHWNHMVDDILMKRRDSRVDDHNDFSDKQLQFFALAEIDKLLKSIGKSLKHFKQLPQPPTSYLQTGLNNLVVKETSYNLTEMEAQFNDLFSNCNLEQLEIVNEVIKSVESGSGGVYFVYGSGGCRKTFVWKTIIL